MTLSVSLRHRLGDFALDVAFEAPAGVTALFGASGSGKTTVVNAVAGLLQPAEGRVAIDGEPLLDTAAGLSRPPHKRRLGYIFQEARLFPHLSVRRNLTYGRWFAPPGEDDFARVVDMLGVGGLLGRRTGALSGGERQRVAIGRALLARPRLILADEPLSALDDARKEEILPYFERIRDEAKLPVLYVTHSAAEAARLATTVVVLDRGRVVRQGPAAEVLSDPAVTPTGVRAAGAVLDARVARHHDDGLTELDAGGVSLFLPGAEHQPGQRIRIRISAQDVMLSRAAPTDISALNILPGTVAAVRTGEGPGAMVSLDTAAGRLLARVTRRSAAALGLAPGVECHAIVKTVSIARADIGAAGARGDAP